MLHLNDVYTLIQDLEARFPTDAWRVHGVPVWPPLRIRIASRAHRFMNARQASAHTAPKTNRGPLVRGIHRVRRLTQAPLAAMRAALRDPRHSPRHADVMFLSYSTSRFFQIEGRWYDGLCEPLAELLVARGTDVHILERAPDDEYRLPRSMASTLVEPLIRGVTLANARAPCLSPGLAGFPELTDEVARRVPGLTISEADIVRDTRFIRWLSTSFELLLRRARAKVGFVVCYYDSVGMAFVHACHRVGIPCVDVQHGVQGELHPGYGGWSRMSAGGCSVLPHRFWTWSETDAATIMRWGSRSAGAHEAIVGGNQLMAKMLGNSDPVRRVRDVVRARAAGADCNLLVSLQPGRCIPDLIRDAIRVSPPSWRWWVRLHPSMWLRRAEVAATLPAGSAREFLIDATEFPLYTILQHIDVHLTEASSTVLEAEQLGVPSILLDESGGALYGDQLARGTALSAFDVATLFEAVARQRAFKRTMVPQVPAVASEDLIRRATRPLPMGSR